MGQYDAIFKAYDIRGIFPKEIDVKFAYKLGRAFVEHMQVKEVMVAFDGRSSATKLTQSLIKGIQDQGADVINIGLASTPLSYFGMFNGKYESGIMVTASHNPKQYNGFKMMGKLGKPIHQLNGSLEIMNLIHEDSFSNPKKKGKLKKKSWNRYYEKFLKGFFPAKTKIKTPANNLKIVVDQSNGSGVVEVEVLKKYFKNCKVINARVAGTFPGHDPDPTKPQNRKQLVLEIKKNKADIGIIFDGDADRVCFVDEKGQFIRPDIITSILMDDLKKGKVVYDTRSSKYIPEKAAQKGLYAIMSKSGRTNLIDTLGEEQADLGGELSGHYFFKEFKSLDCAGIAAIKVLNRFLMNNSEFSISELVEENNPYFHSGEQNFKVRNQSKAFLILEQAFSDAQKVLYIDGLSVYYKDYWFNIRKSNTEPLIRINAEADSKDVLNDINKKLNRILNMAK